MVIGTILLTGASFTASLFVVQIAVLPLLFKYSKSVQRKMIFSNCINYPRNLDYENPSSCNIVGGRNFNIKFQSKVDDCPIKLGVWHIIPCSMFKDMFIIRDYKTIDIRLHHELKKTKNTIVLYCHGYGDSSRVRPTERGVVEDALKVYSRLNDSLDPDTRPAVLLWGHSLGTAVVANMISHMSELCTNLDMKCLPQPDAVVLEAPFNNLMDEIERHPFSKLVSWLPYYKDTFVKPFTVSSEYVFTTDQYLMKVPHVPILMMHSKCDKVVPYELAVKLHETVAQSRGPGAAPLHFHSFERGAGLGHNNLCEAPDLENIISDFLKQINTRNPE